jgi:hypothetical protein
LVGSGFLGFKFATAFAAIVPSTFLLATPFLCSGAYGHGVVNTHSYAYGSTSGRSVTVGCSDRHGHVHSASSALALLILFVIGTIVFTVVIGAIVALRSGLQQRSGASGEARREQAELDAQFSIGESVKMIAGVWYGHSGEISRSTSAPGGSRSWYR